MKTKHAKGPWKHHTESGEFVITDANGEMVTSVMVGRENEAQDTLALANGLLITAAPELLEALIEIKGLLQDGDDAPFLTIENTIDDAIRKAEGK